jgi:hypothetical protein
MSGPLAAGTTSVDPARADREVGTGVDEAIVRATLSLRDRAIADPGLERRV